MRKRDGCAYEIQDLVLNDNKKANGIFKEIITRCIVSRTIRFREGEISMVMKYEYFLLDNKNDIGKTNGIFKAIVAKCMVNRSILYRQANFEK